MFKSIYHEIDETESLIEHMTGGVMLGDNVNINEDVEKMKIKIDGLRTAISMIKKSAVDIEGIDALWSMSAGERKMLFKVVKFLMLFRRKK